MILKANEKPPNFLFANSILFCAVGLIILFAPTAIAAQANLEKTIERYVEKIRDDASEYKEARKILYGDVDGDGTKDAVVQYTLEGAGGGNSWGQSLVVFLVVAQEREKSYTLFYGQTKMLSLSKRKSGS
jgi:hypothetical protein